MKKVLSPLTSKWYKTYTQDEKFILYRVAYPIVNAIGLNRWFNLLLHRNSLYYETPHGACGWCGRKHRPQVGQEIRKITIHRMKFPTFKVSNYNLGQSIT